MVSSNEHTIINIGPHHPSTHGVFRLRVSFDGEVIQDVEPVLGYMHRGTEKLAEERTYIQVLTLTDRLDWVSAMSNNHAYMLAVERLADIQPTERGMYLRCLASELQRIASHLVCIGFFIDELGAFHTPLIYCFRERERILDLFEMLCGARVTASYLRPGGVYADAPGDFWIALDRFLEDMPGYLDELDKLLSDNEIIVARTFNVACLSPERAINASVSGPVLRSTGIAWDLRKADPYDIYDRLSFEIPVGSRGDNYDRYRVRLEEMRQSLKIIRQCCSQIPKGPVRTGSSLLLRPQSGESYAHVEAPKGELGFYLVSDGGVAPYRCKIRSPSFINLTVLRELLLGWKLADIFGTFGSLDIVMGEVDR